jgi:hypothetical protein
MILAPLLAAMAPMATSVPVELRLDAEGKVVSCMLDEPQLDEAARQRICMTVFRNARFEPARDAAGNPVPSTMRTTMPRRVRASTPAELASAEARAR